MINLAGPRVAAMLRLTCHQTGYQVEATVDTLTNVLLELGDNFDSYYTADLTDARGQQAWPICACVVSLSCRAEFIRIRLSVQVHILDSASEQHVELRQAQSRRAFLAVVLHCYDLAQHHHEPVVRVPAGICSRSCRDAAAGYDLLRVGARAQPPAACAHAHWQPAHVASLLAANDGALPTSFALLCLNA